MITNTNKTIDVTFTEEEACNIVAEIDTVVTKLHNSTVMDLNEINTLLTLKSSIVMGLN